MRFNLFQPRPLIVQLILAVGLSTAATAQYTPSPPGGYGPGTGGQGRMGGGHRMGPRGGRGDMPTREKIEGPATPAIMRDTVGLSNEQLERYETRYTNHMAATRPVRDSLRAGIEEIRAAFESGDRSAVRERRSDLQRQWKDLSKRDKEFDKALKDFLSKDQQKRHKEWNEAREKAARERLENRRR
jgi:hypothetical protein